MGIFKHKYTLSILAILATLSPAQWANDPENPTPRKKRTLNFGIRKDWSQYFLNPVSTGVSFSPTVHWQENGDFRLFAIGVPYTTRKTFETDFKSSGQDYFKHLYSKPIQDASFDEVKDFLRQFNVEGSIMNPSNPLLNVQAAYLLLTAQTNKADINNALSRMSPNMSWEEKITFTRYIGRAAVDRYDDDRNKTSEILKFTDVSFEDVILNLKNPSSEKLGVCRDIARGQAMIMENLGFQDVYLFSYEDSVNHVTVISRNPLDKNQLMHINYDDLDNTNLALGRESLKRFTDVSKYYWIFDAQGKSVAQIPTEISQLLNEGAGVPISLLDPFLSYSQGSIARIGYDSENGYGAKNSISGFAGKTRAGENLVGAAYTWQSGDAQNDKSSTTVVGQFSNLQNRWQYEAPDGGKTPTNVDESINSSSLRLAIWQSTNSRWFPLSKKATNPVEVRLGAHHTADISGSYNDFGYSQKQGTNKPFEYTETDYSGNVRLQTDIGIDARKNIGQNGSDIRFRAATQLDMGFSNVSRSIPNRMFPNLYYSYITSKVVLAPETNLNFKAAYGKRVFGDQGLLSAGIQSKKVTGTVGVQGFLDKNSLPIYPGARREGFVNAQIQPTPALQINVGAQQPLGKSNIKTQVNVGVNAKIGLKKRRR